MHIQTQTKQSNALAKLDADAFYTSVRGKRLTLISIGGQSITALSYTLNRFKVTNEINSY